MESRFLERFAFVFFATRWKQDLLWQLRVCLHSLDTRGGAAAGYPRYLVYTGEITSEVREFCDRLCITPLQEERFINGVWYAGYANKALMCNAPAHEVVCLIDLDIVFLGDPTPIFEQAAATGKVHSRIDLISPLWRWSRLPAAAGDALRWNLALNVWRAQYSRFAPAGAPAIAEVPRPGGGGTMPAYFNNGVNFIPGGYLQQLGLAWRNICAVWVRDVKLHRPYTYLFNNWSVSQITYAMALHAAGLPWEILPSRYNLMPSSEASEEDLLLVERNDVVLAHMVRPIRDWLEPECAAEPEERVVPVFRRVREVVGEVPTDM